MTNATLLDRIIGYISPTKSLERLRARQVISAVNSINTNSESGYDVPGSSKRYLRGINVSPNSPDYDISGKKDKITAISRDLTMNTPLASAIIRRTKINVIGVGLRPQSQIDYRKLGISKEKAREIGNLIESEFNSLATSKECDVTGQQTFYEMQELAFGSILVNGDICFTFPYIETPNIKYGTKIKLIESDLLATPAHLYSSENIHYGVEVNNMDRPIAYHFVTRYRGGNSKPYKNALDSIRIPAYDKYGNRQVYHIFFKERVGQHRGVGFLAVVVNMLKQVSKLLESELTAHVVNSFFTVFVKTHKGFNGGLASGFGEDNSFLSMQKQNPPTNSDVAPEKQDVNFQYEMGSGNVIELDDDKEVQLADPRKVSHSFDEFFSMFIKQISACCDLPYEQVLLHFSASYSATRGALLEAWKGVRSKRWWFASNFNQPFYEKVVTEMVIKGIIDAPGFFEDSSIRYAWCKCTWNGAGNGQIDPMKETKAAVLKINNALSNYEKEYNAMHDDGDWDGNVEQLSYERKLLEQNDVVVTSDDTSALPVKPVHIDDKGRI